MADPSEQELINLSNLSDSSEAPPDLFSDFEEKVIEEQSIEQLAAMYRDVYDDVEEYGKQLRKLEQKKTALGEQFCKILLSNGLDSVKTKVGSFAPKVEHCVSIEPTAVEKAFEIIEECGHGGVIKRKVEWQTLNKLYRDDETLVQAIAASDAGVFKTWDKHGIRIRRSND